MKNNKTPKHLNTLNKCMQDTEGEAGFEKGYSESVLPELHHKCAFANDTTKPHDLPAGDFSSWLRHTLQALKNETGTDVTCGNCTACCTSSYFIHIKPEETQTLKRINKKILFAAPGLPKGNMLLGYDKDGRCPMLIDNNCSIYEDRPLTCRNYDCRVFAAAGIAAGDDDKALIYERVRQWKFSFPGKRDRDEYSAVQAAVLFLREHADCFPAGVVPRNPSLLAILAIKVYEVFLNTDEPGNVKHLLSDTEIVKAIIEVSGKFNTAPGRGL
jgi:uncharacterized protein